jgi:glutamine synthetase
VLRDRRIVRLPTSLREAVDAFTADKALPAAFGPDLTASIVAIRESEMELFADAGEQDLAAATRWAH